ncbi:type II toxin-antitoxin system prevent-host-death family antitoxin [Erythromicrobium ramosum]|uniref:Type II toxin-antitoxin system prevent-host-death family antitoxin n=1 Tax=Erythrobacter ramosus TaxID=35811 RepID=A0A6I4UH69_9SPHN|nr:type II toxin-antitoxin system prevent-host-death family antitoxin [Erythrobacter ramosus]
MAEQNHETDSHKLIDITRAGSLTVEKHERAVVVILAVGEYERLKEIEAVQNG